MRDMQYAFVGRDVEIGVVLEIYAWHRGRAAIENLVFGSDRYRNILTFQGRVNLTEARISGAPTFESNLFDRDGEVGGPSLPEYGQITLDNTDHGLNYLREYNLIGADWILRVDTPERLTVSTAITASGKIRDRRFGDAIRLSVRDTTAEARNAQVPANRFGTTYHGVPVDGEMQGQVIPIGLGYCYGRSPITLINSTHLVGIVHDGPITVAGVMEYLPANEVDPWQHYKPGMDYADAAALIAADVAAGSYATCAALGLIRLGSMQTNSDVRVTWQGHSPTGALVETHAQIFAEIAARVGLATNAAMIDEHAETIRPESAGLVLREQTTGWDLLNQVAFSANSYMTTELGQSAYLMPHGAPSATPDHEIDCDDPNLNAVWSDDVDVIPYRTVVGRWEQAYEGFPGTYEADTGADIPGWPGARVLDERPFFYSSNGDTVAALNRWLNYLRVGRRVWTLRIEWRGQPFDLGDTLSITSTDHGWSAKRMRLIGYRQIYPIPSGAEVDHVFPVILKLAEDL